MADASGFPSTALNLQAGRTFTVALPGFQRGKGALGGDTQLGVTLPLGRGLGIPEREMIVDEYLNNKSVKAISAARNVPTRIVRQILSLACWGTAPRQVKFSRKAIQANRVCQRGHLMTDENSYMRKTKGGYGKRCLQCDNITAKKAEPIEMVEPGLRVLFSCPMCGHRATTPKGHDTCLAAATRKPSST